MDKSWRRLPPSANRRPLSETLETLIEQKIKMNKKNLPPQDAADGRPRPLRWLAIHLTNPSFNWDCAQIIWII
jgi:hypothetical protein